MKYRTLFATCLLCLIASFPVNMLFAQDSILSYPDSSKVFFFHNDFESRGTSFLTLIDTSITNVERYDPPDKKGRYFASLGNPGLATVNMIYHPRISSGFDFGLRAFDQYMFFNDSVKYYWVEKPYTQLEYIMGAKKEQDMRIMHSQNVASWLNVGLHFRYVNSPGYYRNQKSDDKNFVFTTRFQTPNYRYIVLANYLHNKLRIQENGGIKYDSVFEQNIITDRRGITVNLSTANNFIKENNFYVKQLFKLTKRNRFESNDTTAHNSSFLNNLNPGNISHSILLSGITYLYRQNKEDNNGFYNNTNDSLHPTYDSTHVRKIENRFSWTNSDNAKDHFFTFNFMLRYLYIENSIDTVKAIFNQLIPTGEINFRISDLIRLNFFGDFVTGNSNAGDFNLDGKLVFNLNSASLTYGFQTANQEAPRIYNYYISNHFVWDNNLKKQYFIINKIDFKFKNFQTDLDLYTIDNFVYLDSLALPAQLDKNLKILRFKARKIFKLGNWSLDASAIYQKSNDTKGISLPEWIGDVSIYYTKDLFKKAAILQTGFNALYNTPYYAYAYMPATRDFYIQNRKKLGNYYYTNVFLNLQIKRARLFLKYYNIGYLAGYYDYFTVPTYPMKDGGFRFGISWIFYD